MKKYNKKNIIDTLKKVGLKSGQIVYIDSELFKFGSLYEAKNKNHYYKIFFDSIYEIIGKNGTIATNSYTFQTLRYGKKFIYEKTKCTSGEFSDYIRKKRGSLRSQHPVFSVTALGKHKKYLCSNNSSHNYGYNSPYQRFLELDGKVLNLATDPCFNPFLHVAEFLSGVPYFYNKLTKVNYYKNNKKVNKYFSSSVRYLDLDMKMKLNELKKLKRELIKKKVVKTANLGSSKIYFFSAKKYLNIVLKSLEKDQFAFFKISNFKKNKMPYK